MASKPNPFAKGAPAKKGAAMPPPFMKKGAAPAAKKAAPAKKVGKK